MIVDILNKIQTTQDLKGYKIFSDKSLDNNLKMGLINADETGNVTSQDVANFVSEVTKNFSSASSVTKDTLSIKSSLNNLLKEMQVKKINVNSDDLIKLKTDFRINGADFTFDQLQNVSKQFKYAESLLKTPGSPLEYKDYAKMGMAKNLVVSYSNKNLNAEQAKLFKSAFSARMKNIINAQNAPHKVHDTTPSAKIENPYDNKFTVIQPSEKVKIEITDLFANTDLSDKTKFNSACNYYKELMNHVYNINTLSGSSKNVSLTNSINSDINEFKNIADGSHKKAAFSALQVRKQLGSRTNILDTKI